jgi:hypothetical protein
VVGNIGQWIELSLIGFVVQRCKLVIALGAYLRPTLFNLVNNLLVPTDTATGFIVGKHIYNVIIRYFIFRIVFLFIFKLWTTLPFCGVTYLMVLRYHIHTAFIWCISTLVIAQQLLGRHFKVTGDGSLS